MTAVCDTKSWAQYPAGIWLRNYHKWSFISDRTLNYLQLLKKHYAQHQLIWNVLWAVLSLFHKVQLSAWQPHQTFTLSLFDVFHITVQDSIRSTYQPHGAFTLNKFIWRVSYNCSRFHKVHLSAIWSIHTVSLFDMFHTTFHDSTRTTCQVHEHSHYLTCFIQLFKIP